MATILTKRSNTASSVPLAGDLTNSTSGAELAVNTADKRVFTKDSGGTVVELGTNPSSLTLNGGTANGLAFLNASKVLTTGSALTFDGTNLGVGTASAGVKLDVSGAIRSIVSGGTPIIYFNNGTTQHSISNSSGAMPFALDGSEQMRLTSTGLGIGTSSPLSPLDVVVGAGGARRVLVNYDDSIITIKGASNTANPETLRLVADNIRFNTGTTGSGTERMRLDNVGNLGLGVTPSAWRTSEYKAVQVGIGASFYGRVTAGDEDKAGFSANAFYDQTDNRWEYIATDSASRYDQAGGGHYWYQAASGTAGNAISFTQAMTLDASGRLIVGATSVTGSNQVEIQTSLTNGLWVQTGSTSSSNYVADFRTGSNASVLALRADNTALVSGNLLVGTTSTISAGKISVSFAGATQNGITLQTTLASTGSDFMQFFNSAGSVAGKITQNGTTTVAYTTSSDYRLKENIQPMQNALGVVAQLNPVTYTWKADGSDGQGFIAHELQAVVPDCVTGEKDAVDAEGNPVYQGIDTSFLVATLTAAIQELKAEFDAYKASHP